MSKLLPGFIRKKKLLSGLSHTDLLARFFPENLF